MIKLISCISLDYDLQLLPHFLKHYCKLDIDVFHFILHSNQYSNLDIEKLYDEYFGKVTQKLILENWSGVFDGITKTNKLNRIIQSSKESHIVMADVDEFQEWKKPLKESGDLIWGKLRDRESTDKKLNPVSEGLIFDQFPLITSKTWWPNLFKPCLFPSSDILRDPHRLKVNTNPQKDIINIDHFRWIEGRLEKMIERKSNYETLRKQGARFDDSPLGKIPVKDSEIVVGMYRNKTLL